MKSYFRKFSVIFKILHIGGISLSIGIAQLAVSAVLNGNPNQAVEQPQQNTKSNYFKNSVSDVSTISNESLNPIFPLLSSHIMSSGFGYRLDPFTGQLENHQGVDFPAISGTSILATENGTVIQAGYHSSYGNFVELDHGQGYTSKYGHASALLVQPGQVVKKGQIIAKVGSTGYSTGPHLHFEMTHLGQVLNPLTYLTQGFSIGEKSFNTKTPARFKNFSNNDYVFTPSKVNKPYYSPGDLVAVIRVRSGRVVK